MRQAFGEEIGQRSQSLRKRAGLSLHDLAERCHIRVSLLTRIEREEVIPTVADLARISAGLDLPITALLENEMAPDGPNRRPMEMADARGLGAQVRALRESNGQSLQTFSKQCGVSPAMLSLIEREETTPTIQVADRVAAGFGLSLVELFRSDVVLPSLDLQVKAVSAELIKLFIENPGLMYDLRPRQFEELMAEIYARQGFEVELTPQTRDGGVDLYLVRHTSLGRLLTLVDVKRYRADRIVGVGAVRHLFGVVEAENASTGVIATTSFFSPEARRLEEEIPFRLGLQDFRDLHLMLRQEAG